MMNHYYKWFSNLSTIFWMLIVWLILGFFAHLDYTEISGCIIQFEPVFSAKNLVYTGISLGLISIGYFIPNKSVSTIFLLLELTFWIYKLLFLKEGYQIGYGGVPSQRIVIYDTLALSLRLVLIIRLNDVRIKLRPIFFIVILIMMLKIAFFESGNFEHRKQLEQILGLN
jgi:hypothetical protein